MPTTPKITPDLAEKLAREGEDLRREYRRRVRQMHDVSPERDAARRARHQALDEAIAEIDWLAEHEGVRCRREAFEQTARLLRHLRDERSE